MYSFVSLLIELFYNELALKNTETTSAGLNIVKNINGFDFKLNLDQNIFAESFDQNASIYIYKEYLLVSK